MMADKKGRFVCIVLLCVGGALSSVAVCNQNGKKVDLFATPKTAVHIKDP
jgi:hypothetical protein